MKINDQTLENNLNHALGHYLNTLTSSHELKEAYHYAVLPAGKLFRPKLVWNTFLDLAFEEAQKVLNDQKLFLKHPITKLSCAIEIHHAYTLVHDDLPSMDNDLMRRGKPSLHNKYGEWRAILVGDGLLNMSYQILSKIDHPEALNVIKIFSHATGPKGLIEGQVLDLSHEMNLNLENLIRTHELKTARLIQASLSLSALMATHDKELSCKYWRAGYHLGVLFQLIDDLMELKDKNLTEHEIEVNPYLKYFNRTFPALLKEWKNVNDFIAEENKTHLKDMIQNYLQKNLNELRQEQKTILQHIEDHHAKNSLMFNKDDQIKLEKLLNGNFVF